ncbi:MAG: hypothetical protein E7I87_08605, partial [Streptococcus mitis]|nr:hypothetical protein [Streptococcus mitis]
CQKCQHDSINAKELNGFDVDDFLHDKTSLFYLSSFYSKRMEVSTEMIKNFSKEILLDFFI